MADWRKGAEINADVVYYPMLTGSNSKQITEVFVWDLDKTYLDTRLENLRSFLRIAFEKPTQKRNIPGTGTLMCMLGSYWRQQNKGSTLPIYFITASPPQIKDKIVKKLKHDKVDPHGMFFKDNLQNLRPGRLWRLSKQVGYKLQALLQLRLQFPEKVRFTCWGDDSEFDATVYSLFSDICARRLSRQEITTILKAFSVVGSQLQAIFNLQSRIPHWDPLYRIYINLAEDTDAEYYSKFGRRCMPTYSSFQSSLDLYQGDKLDLEGLCAIADTLLNNYNFSTDELERHFDGSVRRKILTQKTVEHLLPHFKERGLLSQAFELSVEPVVQTGLDEESGVIEIEGQNEPWVPEHIDYLRDYR